MVELVLERRRTGRDVVLGALLTVGGLVLLGHAAVATTVSVLFVGWVLLLGGLLALGLALLLLGEDGFASAAVSGGLLTALGLLFLRNTEAAAVTLTLVAGTVFLLSGLVRLVVAAQEPQDRLVLAVSGAVSVVLGLVVLLDLLTASLTVLGVLLGVQVLVDGLTLLAVGRLRPVRSSAAAGPVAA